MEQPPEPSTAASPAEVVATLYAALAADDLATAAGLLHPEVLLHVPGTHDLAGDHHGIDAFAGFVLASRDRTGGSEHVEVLDLLAGRDHAAAYCRVTATREGRAPLDNSTLHLLRVHEGRITECWFHNRDAAAVDAFWS